MIEKSGPKKILVVDDDREWNLVLRLRLERENYIIEQAFNGLEALEKIKADKPDLVLLDIGMPVTDGWKVCGTLRNQEETKDLPVIMISSFNRPDDVLQSKTFRVKRFLIKPCSLDTVVQNVRDVLG
jgi:CheY-like chemotaxis protein